MANEIRRDTHYVVDSLLLLTVVVWAVNFPLVKLILLELPPLGFNVLRLVGASVILLTICILRSRTPVIDRNDWLRLALISFVGHTCYQMLFVLGVHRTSASNSAILLGLTPVFVAILGTLSGEERHPGRVWLGVGLSFAGVTLVLRGSHAGVGSLEGDMIILASSICWSVYTVFGRPLVRKYGSMPTTAYSLAIGSALFLPFGVPSLGRVAWSEVSRFALLGTVASCLGALVLAYLIWYYALARVGPTRTAIYSNLMPVITMVVSYFWIDEAIGSPQLLGAAAILGGIGLVRGAR